MSMVHFPAVGGRLLSCVSLQTNKLILIGMVNDKLPPVTYSCRHNVFFHVVTSLDVKYLPTTCPPPTRPSFPSQGWGLISGPLSPAAIWSSRTETRYLALCGRLEMELFIRPTLSCLLCAGFIIASAMFGRQYLSLVSCAATCLLFHWRWAWALAIYHPLWGAPW